MRTIECPWCDKPIPEPVRGGKSISELGLENEILVVKLAEARRQLDNLSTSYMKAVEGGNMSDPTQYEATDIDLKRIERDFTHHAPKGDQAERYQMIRSAAKAVAANLLVQCPPSRERSLALTHLEESVFWANAAIARNE